MKALHLPLHSWREGSQAKEVQRCPIIESDATPTLAWPSRAGKHYSQFAILDPDGQLQHQARVDHEPGAIHAFLQDLPEGTPVALESVGNWYSR
jgi:hypothetical protein